MRGSYASIAFAAYRSRSPGTYPGSAAEIVRDDAGDRVRAVVHGIDFPMIAGSPLNVAARSARNTTTRSLPFLYSSGRKNSCERTNPVEIEEAFRDQHRLEDLRLIAAV